MKITYILATIGLIALQFDYAFSTPWPPYRSMDVPYCEVVVDGTLDECYNVEQSTDWIYPSNDPSYTGPDDFTAVFNIAYDFEYLYIFATLTDDIAENYQWGYENERMFDNIEWFVRYDTTTDHTEYDDSTVHLRINRGPDSVMTPGNVPRSAYQYYMEDSTGTGWLTEVGMPWSAVFRGGTLPEGFEIPCVIGFDFAASDADNSDGDPTVGNTDFMVAWDPDGKDGTEDRASFDVTVFGYIDFGYCISGWGMENYTVPELIAFPNPAGDVINFRTEGVKTVVIIDITGKPVLFANTSGEIEISGLKSGFYLARVNDKMVWFVKE